MKVGVSDVRGTVPYVWSGFEIACFAKFDCVLAGGPLRQCRHRIPYFTFARIIGPLLDLRRKTSILPASQSRPTTSSLMA